MNAALPDWAVYQIVNRAGQPPLDASDRERIVLEVADAARSMFRQMADGIEIASTRYSVLMRPRLTIDGNQWCALYGENLQDGVAGFGDSPAAAMEDFDRAWIAKLPSASPAPRAPGDDAP